MRTHIHRSKDIPKSGSFTTGRLAGTACTTFTLAAAFTICKRKDQNMTNELSVIPKEGVT